MYEQRRDPWEESKQQKFRHLSFERTHDAIRNRDFFIVFIGLTIFIGSLVYMWRAIP